MARNLSTRVILTGFFFLSFPGVLRMWPAAVPVCLFSILFPKFHWACGFPRGAVARSQRTSWIYTLVSHVDMDLVADVHDAADCC